MSERYFIAEYRPATLPAKSIASQCGCHSRRTYKVVRKAARNNAKWGFDEKLVFPKDALAPPLPGVEADTLLLAGFRNHPITLRFRIPAKVVDPTQDAVLLLVDGSAFSIPITFEGYKAGDIFSIELPASARKEGTHTIQYRIHYSNNQSEDGPLQSFKVDLTAPGLPSLAELNVDPAIRDGGVTSATLEIHNGKHYLKTTLNGYNGLGIGDRIRGVIADLDGFGSTTDVEQEIGPGDEIILRFLREDIERAGDGLKTFAYTVTDRAGNISLPSRPVTLKVLLDGELTNLPAPEVADSNDGIINDEEARNPLEVIIPAYSDKPILPGDAIELIWGDAQHEPLPIPDGEEGARLPMYPDYAALYDTWKAQSQGRDETARITVSYRIIRQGMVAGTSAGLDVVINLHQVGGDPEPEVPTHPNLRPAVLMSWSGQLNYIPKDDYDKDARLFVPWFDRHSPTAPVLIENDVVRLRYGTHAFLPRTVSAADVGKKVDLEFALTADLIAGQGGGTQALTYEVERPVQGPTHNTSKGPAQPVLVDADEQLPGDGDLGEGEYAPLKSACCIVPTDLENGKIVYFVTPPYKHKRPGDLIEIDLVQVDGIEHTNNEAPLEESRITLSYTVLDASEETEEYKFPLPTDKLLAPKKRCHIHSTWRVLRNGKPVENDTTALLIVDSRGTP
ncbi:hypothetical protein HU735_22145 [Pseudomonas sp. BW16M2]|uniref:hypothetical protein n=1 Tax=Pseudomonas sp. BW16M2 TaxID=2745489 RepID=UPI0016447C6A|nr:hypothetical protein [Pseudomonas sp. BW16M2]MBC3438127.1 hypothetical protein [Pseudomonas sp. BW16M2]